MTNKKNPPASPWAGAAGTYLPPGIGPSTQQYAHQIVGFQHEVEWGTCIVGIRCSVPIKIQAFSWFGVPEEGEGIIGLRKLQGNRFPFFIHQGPLTNEGEHTDVDIPVSPDQTLYAIVEVEPVRGRICLSLVVMAMLDHKDQRIDFTTKTLELMPTKDVDLDTIDFEKVIWR